ncbi:C39 family peptidase [Chloroflexota bacterium]
MINLRIARQNFDFDCGVTALQVVMEYYGVDMRADQIMKELKTSKDGTNHTNMIDMAKSKGFQVFASGGVSLEELKRYVDAGHPVIVVLQAWANRYMTLEDWKTTFDFGHYTVVIGYEGKVIIFEDPATTYRTWMLEDEFLARWHDQDPSTQKKLEHFAMVLLGKEPVIRTLQHMD